MTLLSELCLLEAWDSHWIAAQVRKALCRSLRSPMKGELDKKQKGDGGVGWDQSSFLVCAAIALSPVSRAPLEPFDVALEGGWLSNSVSHFSRISWGISACNTQSREHFFVGCVGALAAAIVVIAFVVFMIIVVKLLTRESGGGYGTINLEGPPCFTAGQARGAMLGIAL